MKLLPCLNTLSPLKPQKVLCISKLSSLEFLKFRNPNLNEDQILSKMKEQGKDPQEILVEHRLQIACEKNLESVFKKLNISFRITKRIVDASRCVNWADLVIPVGGDGTFLLASKLISDNTKPVFGINPSVSSESNVFTLPSRYTNDIESVFAKLQSGEYTLLMRSRIRTVMNGEGLYTRPFHIHEKSRIQGERRVEALIRSTQKKIADALQPRERVLPWLALNEVKYSLNIYSLLINVFMGEFSAARPISLIINVKGQTHRVRSSGVCVCTGSGSRSWYKSMNLQPADTVQRVVEIATGKKLNTEETNDLLYKYHRALMYPPEDTRMTYMIRELTGTTRCIEKNCCPEREKCDKLTVISGGFDAGLVIDGSISLPFNDGTVASFEIRPEHSLKQIVVT